MKATRALWIALLFSSFCWPQAPLPAPAAPATQQAPAPETKDQQALAAKDPAAPPPAEPENVAVSGVFHIVGVPGLKRNARGDLLLGKSDLTFKKGNKPLLVLPFTRIQKFEVLSGERHYGKTAAAVSAVSPVAGAFVMFVKRHVDTVVVEYVNERNGKMAMVLQLPEHEGARCQQWLERHGAKGEGQEPQPATPEKK